MVTFILLAKSNQQIRCFIWGRLRDRWGYHRPLLAHSRGEPRRAAPTGLPGCRVGRRPQPSVSRRAALPHSPP